MTGWWMLAILALLIVVFVVGLHFGWIDMRRARRSAGSRGNILGGVDEVFHPTRYEVQLELDRQTVLPAPAPVPSDGPAVYQGQVRIELPEDTRR